MQRDDCGMGNGMPTLFPGMDPYLEQRGLWEEVHINLIVAIRQFLTPIVRPQYRVAIGHRVYQVLLSTKGSIEGITEKPEEVVERYLEIRDTATQQVITAIEILSPTNKEAQDGRQQYEKKRLTVLASATNLVEIDLLRAGKPFAMKVVGQTAAKPSHYRIAISRSWQRPGADLYLFNVRQPIPAFLIPLRPGEQEPVLPLNRILHDLYDQGGYDLAIDYSQPADPPLSREDVAWAVQLLLEQPK